MILSIKQAARRLGMKPARFQKLCGTGEIVDTSRVAFVWIRERLEAAGEPPRCRAEGCSHQLSGQNKSGLCWEHHIAARRRPTKCSVCGTTLGRRARKHGTCWPCRKKEFLR